MKQVELYARVRHAVMIGGMSRREAARLFGLNRRTIEKMLRFSVPPGYRRERDVKRPKLGAFIPVIDAILSDDKQRPKKQHHTIRRIFERLRDEYGYSGGITIVSDYVREHHLSTREMFVPLAHAPGHAQVDFGEAVGIIGGVECKLHFFCMDLPHSDGCFVKAYPAETTEAFCDGHVSGFAFFGGIPLSILYDNTTIAVARILGDGKRKRTKVFGELQSHYLFEDRFGRPGKGNDKGKVEGLVGYCRRNFMVPRPAFASFEDLNIYLESQCRQRMKDKLRGHQESIETRLARDTAAFQPLPSVSYDPCDKRTGRVSSLSLVRYKGNDYSVPVAFGHREVLIRGYVNEVVFSCGAHEIARHKRSWEKADFIFNPLHYLALIERKTNALDQAAPLQNWFLPNCFGKIRRLLEARMGKKGKREFVQILRLMEIFHPDQVSAGIEAALEHGTIGFDAVKHLVLCHVEHRPPCLDMTLYPYWPKAYVAATLPGNYLSLLSGGCHE